jgi:hypothetical protein
VAGKFPVLGLVRVDKRQADVRAVCLAQFRRGLADDYLKGWPDVAFEQVAQSRITTYVTLAPLAICFSFITIATWSLRPSVRRETPLPPSRVLVQPNAPAIAERGVW